MLKKLGLALALVQSFAFALAIGLDLLTNGHAGAACAFAQSAQDVASIPETTFPDVSGDWSGTLTDGNKGSGAVDMMIAQTGGKLSGTWSVFFAGGTPLLKGKVSSKGIVHLKLALEDKCHLVATATLVSANEMAGTYKYASCSKSVKQDTGTFDVTR